MDVSQKDVQALSEKLNQKLDTKDCVFTLPGEEEPVANQGEMGPEIRDMVFEIKGDKCPMTAYIKVDSNDDKKNIRARFEMGLIVKTPELQKEMNMKEGYFGGDMAGVVNQTSESSAQMHMDGTFSGHGVTLDFGPFTSTSVLNLDFSMSMPQQPDPNGVIQLNLNFDVQENNVYSFQDERSTFGSHVVMGSNGMSQSFVINGQPASPEKYAEYSSKIGIPGFEMGHDVPGSNQPPVNNSNCELLAFESSKVPESTIQQVMQTSKNLNSLRPMAAASVNSCGVMQETQSVIAGRPATLRLMFMSTSNMAYVDVGGVQKNLALQPEFEDYVTSSVSGVSLVYTCKPVASCE